MSTTYRPGYVKAQPPPKEWRPFLVVQPTWRKFSPSECERNQYTDGNRMRAPKGFWFALALRSGQLWPLTCEEKRKKWWCGYFRGLWSVAVDCRNGEELLLHTRHPGRTLRLTDDRLGELLVAIDSRLEQPGGEACDYPRQAPRRPSLRLLSESIDRMVSLAVLPEEKR